MGCLEIKEEEEETVIKLFDIRYAQNILDEDDGL